MATHMIYRTVSPTIWNSPTFHYLLHHEQVTMLCLLTHSQLKRFGLLSIFPDELGHITRQTKNQVLGVLATLERHRIIEWDPKAPMVAFPKYFRYNAIETISELALAARQLPLLPKSTVRDRQTDRFVAHINT
ncbi:MAG TPA: hypothetical protein PKL84_03670, partial [Candidatus Hydrogenedentes bacterium]|nr:hypothetical protein [Candidatus Hydrogenedentota bacterium]